jgi:long-chain fatty acid transport protein
MTTKIDFDMRQSWQRCLATLLALCATPAFAGGLWISEFGSPAMGRAGAGSAAGTDDASAALHNPASMSRIKQPELMVSAGLISSTLEFDVSQGSLLNGTGGGGDAGDTVPGGSLFYVHPFNERLTFGVSVAGLTGAVVDYDNDWVGRFQATDVDLIGLAVMPAVSFRVNEMISLGLAVPVMYSDLELKIAVPTPMAPGSDGRAKLDGDDTQVGWNISALIEFDDATRLGIFYQSKFEFEYGGEGNVDILPGSLSIPISTKLTLAPMIKLGITREFGDSLKAHLTFDWEEWTEMEDVIVSGENDIVLPRNWDNTFKFAAGIEYQLNPAWTLNTGLSYDTDPTSPDNRTADMPLDEQWRFAVGAVHERASGMTIGAHLVYADYGSADIDRSELLPLVGFTGDYKDNNLIFFSVSLGWKFGAPRR